MLQTKTDREADIFRKRCGQACRRRLQQATAPKGNPVARDRGRQQKGERYVFVWILAADGFTMGPFVWCGKMLRPGFQDTAPQQ